MPWKFTGGIGVVKADYMDRIQRQYSHCAIQYSDFLKENNGIVYTIGLGLEEDPGSGFGTAYSDIEYTLQPAPILSQKRLLELYALV